MFYFLLLAAAVIGLSVFIGNDNQKAMKEFCDLECKSSKIKKYKFCC